MKESLAKMKTEKEGLDKAYDKKIQDFKSLKITKEMIEEELKKDLSKRV